MQPIERAGVITLLFIVVAIAAVAMWDEGGQQEATQLADAGHRTTRTVSSRDSAAAQPRPDSSSARASTVGRPRSGVSARDERSARAADRRRRFAESQRQDSVVPALSGTIVATTDPLTGASSSPGGVEPSAARIEAPAAAGIEADATQTGAKPGVGRDWTLGRTSTAREETSEQPRTNPVRRALREADMGSGRKPVELDRVAGGSAGTRAGRARTVVLARGETLSHVAARELGDAKLWRLIAQANDIEHPERVAVGQELIVPRRGESATAEAGGTTRGTARVESTAQVRSSSAGRYVIASGDTLSQIAQEQLGGASRWKEILAANPGLDAKRLVVGREIRLPVDVLRPQAIAASATPAARGSRSSSGKRNYVR